MADQEIVKLQATALKDKGNSALQEGNFDEAISLYSEAISLDPENHVLYSNRSAAQAKSGKYEDALKDAEKTIEIDPSWSKGYSRKGAALVYLDRRDEAIKAYKDGLNHCPGNAQLQKDLEDTYIEPTANNTGRMPSGSFPNPFADPMLLNKLQTDPRTKAYLQDPSFLVILKDLQCNPSSLGVRLQDPRVITTLGVIMGVDLQTEETMDTSSYPTTTNKKTNTNSQPTKEKDVKTGSLEPAHREAMRSKEAGNTEYKKKNFEDAIKHYHHAIDLYGKDMTFYSNLAAVYFEQGNYQECITQCEKSIDIGRENRADFKLIAKAHTRIGNSYRKMKEYTSAKTHYEKALSEHRTPDVRLLLAEVEKLKKEQEYKAYIDPTIAEEEKELGNDFFKKGDYATAMKHYTEAIRRNPEDAKLFSNRAACYTKLAAFDLGLKDCDKCVELEPKFIKGWIRKGKILHGMQDPGKAMTAYQKAMEIDSSNAEALDGYRSCLLALNSNPEEIRKRAMADPDIQAILRDPAMRMILEQMQDDPKALHDHLKNPEIAAKIQKLMESGLIAIH